MQDHYTCPVFDASTHKAIDRWTSTVDSGGGITFTQVVVSIKDDAIGQNNAAAGRAREQYLTAVPGQSTTYAAKQAEAARWVAAGRPAAPSATEYPWASDRAGLRAVSVAEVLAEWEAVAIAWAAIGRAVEHERERVNLLIRDAANAEAVQAALDSAAYPSPT